MFQTKVADKIKNHNLCSETFSENLAFYEKKKWKNVVDKGRPQMTVLCMHIACWISKATNIQTKVV
jgi:hypothetical protein